MASGKISVRTPIDRALAPLLREWRLFCGGNGDPYLLRQHTDQLADNEVFITFLDALFTYQRLDLIAAIWMMKWVIPPPGLAAAARLRHGQSPC
jgi:hypothetical protein